MQKTVDRLVTRTTADVVFEHLNEEISTLRLLPGTRISEADIANQMGVSRQPVRDAFNRLANLGLLLIRPQRATEVRGFSMAAIENARFVRLAVELEVVTRACATWTTEDAEALEAQIDLQMQVVKSGQTSKFHDLDYTFHKMICGRGGHPLAFDMIEDCKRTVDRLCVLSLRKAYEVEAVIDDHKAIAASLANRSVEDARRSIKTHLNRLDETIREIHEAHANYFE